jgi:hypothetical protein
MNIRPSGAHATEVGLNGPGFSGGGAVMGTVDSPKPSSSKGGSNVVAEAVAENSRRQLRANPQTPTRIDVVYRAARLSDACDRGNPLSL